MADKDEIKIKKLLDHESDLKKKDTMLNLFKEIDAKRRRFLDAWATRRQRLLEINAIYRGKSYLDEQKVDWQTRSFYNLSYDAVERKTSILLQALWGNKLASPFSCFGQTAEDQEFAEAAEGHLNNTSHSIGLYPTSEENLRTTCKYGLGILHYGWERRMEPYLGREVVKDAQGNVMRDSQGRAILKFFKRERRISQPFAKNVDIVDHFGFDPQAKKFTPWMCDFAYIVEPTSPEAIHRKEQTKEFYAGSFDRLKESDPHGLRAYETARVGEESKEPQIRRDDGIQDETVANPGKPTYKLERWWLWFDIDGDGQREYIECVVDPASRIVFRCQEALMFEYPFVDVHFTRSLHGMTSWGVLDPVVELQYDLNERRAQRGDATKFKLNPQFMINMDMIYEDHAYVSLPGAFHPFRAGDDGDVRRAMFPVQFDNPEYLSWQDEDRDVNTFSRLTGVADLNSVLTSSNKDTPASTVLAIFNEQQAGNSLIINGILERYGELGQRLLQQIQLFGDPSFTYKVLGKKGFDFRQESMENILGRYDVKVTTSTFFGNKNIELQQLINLRPYWVDAQHVDLVELDKMILEQIAPKRADKIIVAQDEPLTPVQEQALCIAGQIDNLKPSPQETVDSLRAKIRAHETFMGSSLYPKLHEQSRIEFEEFVLKLTDRAEVLEAQLAQQQQDAARGGQGVPGIGGNINNTGNPIVRQVGNQGAPRIQ